jgi:beta-lactamase class A
MTEVAELAEAFRTAGVEGWLHATDIDTGREVAYRSDELIVLASTVKLPVLVELMRQGATGQLMLTEPTVIPVDGRTPGPFGISVMRDSLTMSWRDLAWMMIGISDNAATDHICARVGLDAVNATMARLGLAQTVLVGDCLSLFRAVVEDLGGRIPDAGDLADPEVLGRLRILDPAATSRSTPSEMSRLLGLIWTDRAAPAPACAEVRRLLGQQVWPHRLAAGFPEDEIKTSGKTGSLPRWRNEVGVVEYPDGGRYAVSVFTRSQSTKDTEPAADAVVGQAARLAVESIRRMS